MFTSKKSLFSKSTLRFLFQPSRRMFILLLGCIFTLPCFGQKDSLLQYRLTFNLKSPIILSNINSNEIGSVQKASLSPEICFSSIFVKPKNLNFGVDVCVGTETYKFNIFRVENKNSIIHKMNLYFFSLGLSCYIPIANKNDYLIFSIKNYFLKPYKYSVIDKGLSSASQNNEIEIDKNFSGFYSPRFSINYTHKFSHKKKLFFSFGIESSITNQLFYFEMRNNTNTLRYKNNYFIIQPFLGIKKNL